MIESQRRRPFVEGGKAQDLNTSGDHARDFPKRSAARTQCDGVASIGNRGQVCGSNRSSLVFFLRAEGVPASEVAPTIHRSVLKKGLAQLF